MKHHFVPAGLLVALLAAGGARASGANALSINGLVSNVPVSAYTLNDHGKSGGKLTVTCPVDRSSEALTNAGNRNRHFGGGVFKAGRPGKAGQEQIVTYTLSDVAIVDVRVSGGGKNRGSEDVT